MRQKNGFLSAPVNWILLFLLSGCSRKNCLFRVIDAFRELFTSSAKILDLPANVKRVDCN